LARQAASVAGLLSQLVVAQGALLHAPGLWCEHEWMTLRAGRTLLDVANVSVVLTGVATGVALNTFMIYGVSV
jgi:hypothetical protein